jgi:hypothetical protein
VKSSNNNVDVLIRRIFEKLVAHNRSSVPGDRLVAFSNE